MKKVLLVATVQSHICQFHKPLVELLHEYGYEVHVAAKNNLNEKNGLKLDFVNQVYDIPFYRSPFSIKNVKAYMKLKEVIDVNGYDIVHCNTPVGGILARLAAQKARKKKLKVYYTAHGFHFYKGAPMLNWMIYYPIEKLFSKKTDKLITIVSEDYNIAKKKFDCSVYRIHGVGVNEKLFHPITNDEKMYLRHKLGFKTENKIILCVGELMTNKNQQMIIRSISEILKRDNNITLLIAGNGPDRESLEELIESYNIQENVKLLGYVTNIHEYHKLSDLLVSCSIREGLGMNVIESMCVGNPVVVTDNRGHRELIDSENNGYLIEIDNIEQMTEKVFNLLCSADEYKRCSDNSKVFSKKYSAEMVKKELENIYELR